MFSLVTILVFVGLSAKTVSGSDSAHHIKPFLLERTPPHLTSYHPERTRYALDNEKIWPAGSSLNVAFYGGSDDERALVEKLANEWTRYGNVEFKFRQMPGGAFLEWSPAESTKVAHVRVSFEEAGCWSAVGKDSIDRKLFPLNKASMNLDLENCPEDEVDTTVLHEFGHALGFLHEHQRPDGACNREFRWHDDDGYEPTKDLAGVYTEDFRGRRPGVFTWCSGPPNRMTRDWIERNLRALPSSSAFVLGPRDKNSIMHYHFPDFFFYKGQKSPCYCALSGRLSKLDIQGVKRAYPGKQDR